jgi:hypothetical protein
LQHKALARAKPSKSRSSRRSAATEGRRTTRERLFAQRAPRLRITGSFVGGFTPKKGPRCTWKSSPPEGGADPRPAVDFELDRKAVRRSLLELQSWTGEPLELVASTWRTAVYLLQTPRARSAHSVLAGQTRRAETARTLFPLARVACGVPAAFPPSRQIAFGPPADFSLSQRPVFGPAADFLLTKRVVLEAPARFCAPNRSCSDYS